MWKSDIINILRWRLGQWVDLVRKVAKFLLDQADSKHYKQNISKSRSFTTSHQWVRGVETSKKKVETSAANESWCWERGAETKAAWIICN